MVGRIFYDNYVRGLCEDGNFYSLEKGGLNVRV